MWFVTIARQFNSYTQRASGDMSGSLSNHNHEGARETSHRHDDHRTGAVVRTEPELTGALPAVPAPEEPPSARPRDVTNQETATEPHRGVPALHEALVRAHKEPTFLPLVSRLLTRGGDAAPHILWRAVHDLLEKGPDGREVVAWDVVQEICRQGKKNLTVRSAVPVLETIAKLVEVGPQGASVSLAYLAEHLPIKPLGVLARLSRSSDASESARGFAVEFIEKHYATLITDADNLPLIADLIRDAVTRHDRTSLKASLFIRERYEACRGWVGKEAELEMIWSMRDQLTTSLLEVPERCEANLKIALMYLPAVPHPSLQREPRRLTESERWILSEVHFLREALGHDYAPKIPILDAKGFLDSSYFVYKGALGYQTPRGVQSFASRFDRDRSVLVPLARGLELQIPGLALSGRQDERWAERPPRTWINRKDRILYEALQVAQACTCVAELYWRPEVADRLRKNAREFVRAIVLERPEALAVAVPSLRELEPTFFGEVQRIAREEALAVLRSGTEASGANLTIRNALIVFHGFGRFSLDLHRLALDELVMALRNPTEATMRDDAFADFVAALRPSGRTSPAVEARAAQAIVSFPDTLVASHLARTLGEVKAVDPDVLALISQQACRVDLEAAVWLNYAHSALLCGVDAETRARVREVLEGRYDASVRSLSRWSSKIRASYRILIGALCPERVGGITQVANVGQTLFKSSLEGLVRGALAQLTDISMRTNHFIPWAPAIDGFLTTTRPGMPAIVLLIDGEKYHSVNGLWAFRGFDGQSLLATKILQRAGYPVLRITAQLGSLNEHNALRSAVSAAFDHLADQGEVTDTRLIVDPDDDFTEIAGKVLLYRPIVDEGVPQLDDHSPTVDIESDGVGASQIPEGEDALESEEREVGD